jgi:hypothetical protein
LGANELPTNLEDAMKVQTLCKPIGAALVHAAFMMALTITASAQITTTGIRGIVRDPNGAVVANRDLSMGLKYFTPRVPA